MSNSREEIKKVVKELMDRVMNKVLVESPFLVEEHRTAKPLYAALVPDEIFKGSHFERRFVTPFGGVWEKLAKVAALEHHRNCLLGYKVDGMIGRESLRRIQEVLNSLETKTKGETKSKPNWFDEIEYIKKGGGNLIPCSVICDIYIESKIDGKKYAFELKAPLPNSDQTKVSKEKMFKLLSMDQNPIDHAYYALPYNPYGKKENYSWSFPMRWFDMKNDESVLIGDEFWDLIGGVGTYKVLISEINNLGKEYRERIYREFLGVIPPDNFDEDLLK